MNEEVKIKKFNLKEWLKSSILGCLLGLAVIVPGVSGAQIAMLFKLYDRITDSLSKIFKNFIVSFMFLLPIIIGALIGFVVGFFAIQQLLQLSTFVLVALFAGMMLGGMPVLAKEVKKSKITPLKIVLLIIGLAIPISISALAINTNFDLHDALNTLPYWMYVIAIPVGLVIALTQLVPGLSATATLISIGLFNPLMESVHMSYWSNNPKVFIFYALLIVGFLLGLFVFSKIITKIIEKCRENFYFMSIGLSISSIISMFYNPELMPAYNSWMINFDTKATIEISIGIPLFLIGCLSVFFLVKFLEKKSTNTIDNTVN